MSLPALLGAKAPAAGGAFDPLADSPVTWEVCLYAGDPAESPVDGDRPMTNPATWNNAGDNTTDWDDFNNTKLSPEWKESVSALNNRPAFYNVRDAAETTYTRYRNLFTGAQTAPYSVVMVVAKNGTWTDDIFLFSSNGYFGWHESHASFRINFGNYNGLSGVDPKVAGAVYVVEVNGTSGSYAINSTTQTTINTGSNSFTEINIPSVNVLDGWCPWISVYDGVLSAVSGWDTWVENLGDYYGITIS